MTVLKTPGLTPGFFWATGWLNGRRWPIAAVAMAFVALCSTTLIGCVSLIDQRAEEIIRSELPRLVGPAREYRVVASGVGPTGGEVRFVQVIGERIARPGSPVIDQAEVKLRDVRIDREAKRIVSLGGADATVRVLATDIASFLDAKQGLDAVDVQFHGNDEISIRARPSVAGFSLPAEVRMRGHLRPDGPRLKLEIADLRAAGFSVGAWPKAAIELLVNPIVDLSELPAPAQITRVRVEGDTLLVEATGVTLLDPGR